MGSLIRPAHHTDRGFRNAIAINHGGAAVALPFFLRRAAWLWRTRPGAAPLIANDGAYLRKNASHSVPTVTWIGHATVLVQMDHATFVTDPMWSEWASPLPWLGPRRFVPPGLAFEALPPIDFVLVSHNHYDHLDVPSLRRLAARGTRFVVPLKVGALLARAGIGPIDELDWWQSLTVGPITIHCVPSQHWSKRGFADDNTSLWAGWAVHGPTRRFYFAGDSGYFPGFAEIGSRLGPFDLAAMPIGAYEPRAMMRTVHLNPEEALQAALDIGAERILGVHYGTFDLTDEPPDEPPRRLHAEAERRGLGDARVWTPALGEIRDW